MTADRYSHHAASAARGAWRAPVATRPLRATVTVPGSKSLTNRELILAALADAPSRLGAPLHSDDSTRMVDALRALGVEIERAPGTSGYGDDFLVTPTWPLRGGSVVDCGQAGTVMRFVAALGGFAGGDVTLTAHESALHRPMGEMIRALRDVGVDIDDGGTWSLPFRVRGHGHVRGGEVVIDASASSQFVSGLLLAAPRFDVGLHLVHRGERLPSMPHIDMTVESLAHRGVHVEMPGPGEWVVPAGPVRGKDVAIEPDLSNAAPFLAAAMIAGGSVTVTGWPAHSTQPGHMLTDILALMGARAVRRGGALTVTAGTSIQGVDLDLSAAGELTPTIFALAAFAEAPTTLYGIGHIRGHETDRIAALVGELRALGGEAHELPDGIRIVPQKLHGGRWRAHHDHRLATTGALIGLAVPGVEVDDIGTTAKTMPQFPQLWQRMLDGDGDDDGASVRPEAMQAS
jgi:3-phosphoshikimate 1-carboxyvinyltransferase